MRPCSRAEPTRDQCQDLALIDRRVIASTRRDGSAAGVGPRGCARAAIGMFGLVKKGRFEHDGQVRVVRRDGAQARCCS